MQNKIHKLIIVGSGPAGLTAAVYAARANLNPIIIEGDSPGGQLIGTSYVENWPGEKSILGPKLMMNMREHAEHFGTQFVSGFVERVDFSQRPFTLWTSKGEKLMAASVIIATGSTAKRLGVPGENEYWGKGITTCAVCDAAFYKDRKVVIVGGGDTAMEDASFLKKFTKNITIIHILDKFTASYTMQQRVINDPDIKVLYNSTVNEFRGDGNHVSSLTVSNQKTGEKTDMDVDGVFIAVGLTPNTKGFVGQIECDKWGYVLVKDHVKTSVEGVFAAGDVHDYSYRQAVVAAGAGCMASLEAERYLAAQNTLE